MFEDAGYSVKNTDRSDYQKMMSRVRSGEFTHILVWKLDRISRNLLDFAVMYDELKKLGVTFVSKNEQFDTSSAMGEAMLKIILVFAELERKMTAERVTAVMVARVGNGQWNGGRVPYGYSRDGVTETFSIVEVEANVVLRMYDMYEERHSLLYVAKTLNVAGIHPRSGKEWSPTAVSIILKSMFYTGAYRYNYFDMSKRGSRQDIKPESEWVIDIANLIKAKESFEKTTSPETLQKKLLRGVMFENVACIKEHGLMDLYSLYKSQVSGIKYTPKLTDEDDADNGSERDILLSERRRIERALSRLKSLYLYSEEDMAEKDYIIEKKQLDEQLEKVNARLDELSEGLTSQFSISDDELMSKASYFIMSQKLSDKRFVNYRRLLEETDPRILKDFINSVSSNFCIENGKIRSITFKNGIIHEFVYKDD